jgi:hypothetical protein
MVTSASNAAPVAGRARATVDRTTWSRASVALLVGLTLAGAILRLAVAGQSLFGDELSTFWIVSTNDLPGVLSILRDRIEITPPLYFVAAWLAGQIDMTPELVRVPSLIAGIAAIPIVHRLGVRTTGRAAGMVAAALTALAPFMIFYSAEARGYELMVVLVMLSTLALLAALDDGRTRWWVAYAGCSCAAALTHYTAVFALVAQLGWVLWAHPEARGPVLRANAAAAIAFLPWLPGLLDDLRMPDSRIMSALSPVTPHTARLAVEHWSVGYPYVTPSSELRDLPGLAGLSLQALGLAIGIAGAAAGALRRRARGVLRAPDRRLILVVVLALSALAGELVASIFGTNLLSARNLAVSWPWFALLVATVLVSAGPRLRYAATGLVIAGFALGAVHMVDGAVERPDFEGAAAMLDREVTVRDAVIDDAVAFITPGPLTGLEAALDERHRIVRAGASDRSDGTFRIGDPVPADQQVASRAAVFGGRVFVVGPQSRPGQSEATWDPVFGRLAGGYHRTGTRVLPGIVPLAVLTYEHAPR